MKEKLFWMLLIILIGIPLASATVLCAIQFYTLLVKEISKLL